MTRPPRRSAQEGLQEEILRERATVLARAGEKVAAALARLAEIDRAMAPHRKVWNAGAGEGSAAREALRDRLNEGIQAFNRQREEARRCLDELVVTREALGLVHHGRLPEFYPLPPRKRPLP